MTERFIKFIPSEKADFLQEHYPNAFLLLCLIARRARRDAGNPDGLLPGDAILGDYRSAGMTRQNYRTSLEKLVELKIVKIIWNGKKFLEREKSTINITIKSTLVNLCDSSIWDINVTDNNQQINQQVTNSQPTGNHKQEGIRKNKNEEEVKEKIKKEKIIQPPNPLIASLFADFFISLLSEVPEHIPTKFSSQQLQKQHSALEKLVNLHGESKVREVMRLAHKDSFWNKHVHTPEYFKNKFEKLKLISKSGFSGGYGSKVVVQNYDKTPPKTIDFSESILP